MTKDPSTAQARFSVKENEHNQFIAQNESGRCLGGVAHNFFRPWVFPLYTPAGHTVLQECPPDHPFHNGFFVGQGDVSSGAQHATFWSYPPKLSLEDHLQDNVGRMDVQRVSWKTHDLGVRFEIESVWRDEFEEPMLDELRTVDLYVGDGATVCDMSSRKTATYDSATFGVTKHGSIGMRVEPRLLPELGGVIIGDRGRRGRADVVHEQESDYVAYEAVLAGSGPIGVLMTLLHDDGPGTWFIRDYGMAMYASTMRSEISLAQGGSWTVALRVVAYDGPLTDERARSWVRAERA